MTPLLHSSRGSLHRQSSGSSNKGLRYVLGFKQLVWLTAAVLATCLITLGPTLATLPALSPGGPDAFPSPAAAHSSPLDQDRSLTGSSKDDGKQKLQQQQTAGGLHAHSSTSRARHSASAGQARRWHWLPSWHIHKQQQQVPVDVVYLWVNGSEPELLEELKRFAAAQPQPQPAAAASKTHTAAAAAAADAASKPHTAAMTAALADDRRAAAVPQHVVVAAQQGDAVGSAAGAFKAASRHLMATDEHDKPAAVAAAAAVSTQQAAASIAGSTLSSSSAQAPEPTAATAVPQSHLPSHQVPTASTASTSIATATHTPEVAPVAAKTPDLQAPATTQATPAKAPAAAASKKRAPVPLPLSELPTRQARFDAGRDELRYSLRSLDTFLPWYRRLYIVTNGQVPSWLDVSHPRVTIVPHSSIFRNASHLPTFNSNAIQANLANIPGLSPHFIMMDDDLFLTAFWNRSDFISPADGGQLITGSSLASNMSGILPMYMKSIQRLHSIFVGRWGPWRRTLPAHAPHYLEVDWLRQLQGELPGEFQQTSAAQLRTPKDVVLSAAYQWYISQFQPGAHPPAPEGREGFASLSNWLAKCYAVAAINDIRVHPQWAKFKEQVRHTKPLTAALNAEMAVGIAAALDTAAAGLPPRAYLTQQRGNHTADLSKAWDQPGVKIMCLNDDIDDVYAAVRPLINPTVVDFLASRYPAPSQYELPVGQTNSCRRVHTKGFGHLPTAADLAAACGRAQTMSKPGPRHPRKAGPVLPQQLITTA